MESFARPLKFSLGSENKLIAQHSENKPSDPDQEKLLPCDYVALHKDDPDEIARYCYERFREEKQNGVACALNKLNERETFKILEVWQYKHPYLFILFSEHHAIERFSYQQPAQMEAMKTLTQEKAGREIPPALIHAINVRGVANDPKRSDDSLLNLLKRSTLHLNLEHLTLMNLDLTHLDLSFCNLSWAHLSHTKLTRVNLYGASLNMTNLYYAILTDVDLREADIKTRFDDLYGALFSNVKIDAKGIAFLQEQLALELSISREKSRHYSLIKDHEKYSRLNGTPFRELLSCHHVKKTCFFTEAKLLPIGDCFAMLFLFRAIIEQSDNEFLSNFLKQHEHELNQFEMSEPFRACLHKHKGTYITKPTCC